MWIRDDAHIKSNLWDFLGSLLLYCIAVKKIRNKRFSGNWLNFLVCVFQVIIREHQAHHSNYFVLKVIQISTVTLVRCMVLLDLPACIQINRVVTTHIQGQVK